MSFARVLIAVSALGALRAVADDGVSQSASYRLQPSTISAGGRMSSSPGTVGAGTLAQAATVGTSSATHFVLQSGFWGFVGSGVVPVVLSAGRTAPDTIDLSWSGNNAPYDLYRAAGCASVFSSVLATTSNNAYADTSAPASGLTCYNVLVTTPGPAPSPTAASP